MLFSMMTVLATFQAQGFQTDTTFGVPQGTRLHVETQGGDITVKAWDRNQVRVQAGHSRRARISIRLAGAVLTLESDSDHGPSHMVDYEITVPAWMSLNLEGMYTTVEVSGVRGQVTAETMDGNITVRGGAESVKLESVQGRLVVQGVRGAATLTTVSESIEASEVGGDVIAETVSGSITMQRMTSKNVEAETVSGNIVLDGRIVDGGAYTLLTHSGGVLVTVAEGSNVTVNAATGTGSLRATFTLPTVERQSRRRHSYTFGSVSATLDIEAFIGIILLLRPAEMEQRLERMKPKAKTPEGQ